jgi:hypothetical protein
VASDWNREDVTVGAEPAFVDTSTAHFARVYDYWLGGKDNFALDRAAAEAALKAFPGIAKSVRANRGFLARAVRFLAGEAGIRQFLDIGTGIPTRNNTHEVAQQAAPQSRVVYVDNDPVVLSHARALPAGSYLALSHPASDINARAMAKMAGRLNPLMSERVTFRPRDAVARFFSGLELADPGMVQASKWRPSSEVEAASPAALWAGVARKR